MKYEKEETGYDECKKISNNQKNRFKFYYYYDYSFR